MYEGGRNNPFKCLSNETKWNIMNTNTNFLNFLNAVQHF